VKGTVALRPGDGGSQRKPSPRSRSNSRPDPVSRPVSDVAESRIKPEIFTAADRVDQLIAEVQSATARLVPAVRTWRQVAIAATYNTVAVTLCNACHAKFRKEE